MKLKVTRKEAMPYLKELHFFDETLIFLLIYI